MAVLYLFLLFGAVFAASDPYEGYSLYKVTAKDFDQAKFVNGLSSRLDIDIWAYASPRRPGMIRVSKVEKVTFEEELKSHGVAFALSTENVKELVDLEKKMFDRVPKRSYNASSEGLGFDKIHTYEEVDAYLESLARQFPQRVTLVNGGKSFEGRDIKYVKISTTNFQDRRKPIVFLESLLHAREWITLPSTLYAIHKLIFNVTEQDLLNDIDWIILPIANPDGFEFTHTENRFWRKNRATGFMDGNFCMGVDLNRNFDFNWSQSSSGNVCWETFHGTGPFSEPEAAIVGQIFAEYGDRMEMFLDMHSYGSYIMYGYGTGVLPPNGLFLHLLAVQMAHAMDAVKWRWNLLYEVGNSAMIMYPSSGSAQDYGKIAGAPFSYTFELPGYSGEVGNFGFLVDPEFIEQVGFEMWEAIKIGARYIRDNRL